MRGKALGLVLGVVVLAGVGCNRGGPGKGGAGSAEAGPGNWARLGPLGLCVESARVGKVRMRGMMGRPGESDRDVFVIKTRFKLFDPAVKVKQGPIHSDGSIILGDAAKLTGPKGEPYKQVVGFGFDKVIGRRSGPAELSADNPEATDLLTFEATAAQASELTLTVPGNWQVVQPDGSSLQPTNPGTFTIRIPRSLWEGAAAGPTVEAGPGNWAKLGPVEVAVEGVRLGKVKMTGLGLGGGGESQDEVLSITTKFRLADPKARVKKSPYMADGGMMFSGPSAALADTHGGAYKAFIAGGFSRVVGRQEREVELFADKPEVSDLLTFEGKAGAADELILTLVPDWQELGKDGQWHGTEAEGEFRFRIPRGMWEKGK